MFPGILDTLTPDQRQQLLTWIELYPAKTVLEMVASPPPDGFGIKTHLTSLRRFYQLAQMEELESPPAAAPASTQRAFDTAVAAMTHYASQIASAPTLAPQALAGATRWLRALRAHQLESDRLQLARDRLSLDRQRLQMLAALKEAASETDYEEDKIQAAVASIIRGENPPPVPRTTEFLNKDLNNFEPVK